MMAVRPRNTDEFHSQYQPNRNVFCGACLEEDVQRNSVAYCLMCDEHLCLSCAKYHRKMKLLRHHVLKEIVDLVSENHPGKPLAGKIDYDSILLIWEPPLKSKEGDYYQISYKDVSNNRKWKVDECEYTVPVATISCLQPNTIYIFRVKVIHENGEEGPYSQATAEIRTLPSLALRLTKTLTPKQTIGSSSIYSLPFTEMKAVENSRARAKRFTFGNPHSDGYVESKTILLVGATGTGKSTFVDGIVNYILGVTWEDPFRFTVTNVEDEEHLNQAISQTEYIKWFTINPEKGSRLNYQLHVIDTPGFGDTRGIERDQEIVEQIRNLFSETEPNGITFIDAVCFLNKAPDARLTPLQSYIFHSIMSLFGRDIESNVCSVITFADGGTPPVLAALQHSGLPFGKPFSFNNSCLFLKSDEDKVEPDFDVLFWNMGQKSFNVFFEHLDQLQSKSLKMSNNVLRERFCLQANFQNLKDSLDVGLKIYNFLKQEKRIIRENKSVIEENRHFEYEVQETKQIKMPIPKGGNDVNCKRCSFKCHTYCMCHESEDKPMCKVMNTEGFCEVCPGKCHVKIHQREDFRYEYVYMKVKKTCADMKEKYCEAEGKLLTHKEIVDRNEQMLRELTYNIEQLIMLIQKCNERLKEIALRPDPITVQEFIDLLIGEEEMSRKDGYLENISNLKELREYVDNPMHFKSRQEDSSMTTTTVKESGSSIDQAFQQITLRLRSYIPNYKQ
ncbi:uncharacterized protein LOC132755759 [Ruditapes philippinarum]|uniref:uncharacterized protein LOC132755759 n=1 Tax=Ruditapes philippinarum TaxID=129788 RepID=UPI00295B68A6|nr:uncharacterized protein LOC132755759 [Ruditapes philippinarum]